MNFLRVVARPLLASPFIGDGWDALMHPDRHVERVQPYRPLFDAVEEATGLQVSDELLSVGTRVLGAATVASALCFSFGRAPRAHACFLASVGIPMALINNPQALRPAAHEQRRHLMYRLALCSGLTFAAFDRGGSPSLSWRLRNARAHRVELTQARVPSPRSAR